MWCGLSAEYLVRNCSDPACHGIRVLVVGGVRLDELAAKAPAAELGPKSATLPRGSGSSDKNACEEPEADVSAASDPFERMNYRTASQCGDR